jgi:predicted ester cyclase
MFCWVAIICSSLGIASGEETKPLSTRQTLVPVLELSPELQAEQSKVPVRQLFDDLFTRGRYELLGQVFANRCPVHFGGGTVGLQQAVAEGKGWRSAAPDLVMSINQISVSGNMVTCTWTAKGTHTGQGNGLKPTGRKISMSSRSQFKVVNGRIVESWNEEYRSELFRQLGISKTAAFFLDAADGLWSAISQAVQP